jgi:hypothetical protein
LGATIVELRRLHTERRHGAFFIQERKKFITMMVQISGGLLGSEPLRRIQPVKEALG